MRNVGFRTKEDAQLGLPSIQERSFADGCNGHQWPIKWCFKFATRRLWTGIFGYKLRAPLRAGASSHDKPREHLIVS